MKTLLAMSFDQGLLAAPSALRSNPSKRCRAEGTLTMRALATVIGKAGTMRRDSKAKVAESDLFWLMRRWCALRSTSTAAVTAVMARLMSALLCRFMGSSSLSSRRMVSSSSMQVELFSGGVGPALLRGEGVLRGEGAREGAREGTLLAKRLVAMEWASCSLRSRSSST